MRRWLLSLVIVFGAILIGRRLAGRLRQHVQALPERMVSHMQQMMEKMPADAPWKVMLSGVTQTREQIARILALLEERLPASEPSPAEEEAVEEAAESEGQ